MSARFDEVVASIGDAVESAPDDQTAIRDVEHDSRLVRPGGLFACIPGAVTDGHLYAEQAMRSGASALLVQRPLGLGLPEILVDDVRRVVGRAAATVYGYPSSKIDVVGITGTNGKTTTVHIVGSLVRLMGGSATEIGTLTGVRTTPEAPELQRELKGAVHRGDRLVAMEVSSHALDLHRVAGTKFKVAAFTNLGIDHLDHHGDVDAYLAAKQRLFDSSLTELAVVNVSTPAGRKVAKAATAAVVEVATDSETLACTASGASKSRFRWRGHSVDLPLGGAFNVANAVIAAEIMVALGHAAGEVAAALVQVDPVPGRFEAIDEGQEFTVIVDYAHTPDGLEAVLNAARQVTRRSLIVVFGAGGDRDRTKRAAMGTVARRLADRVVVTSDNPRGEAPDAIISGIVSGMDRPPELIEPDRREAIRHALAGARAGDVVLIAGKGHEPTQTIGDQVLDFDDRAVAREELRRLVGATS